MHNVLSAVICILSVQMYGCAPMKDENMKMDQIIMAAAQSAEMFDFVHVMDGDFMVMVQLDLLMSIPELEQFKFASRKKRKATAFDQLLWKDCRVYYDFAPNDFTDENKAVIRQAIADWENFTCLNFTQSATQPDRIMFRNGGGCYSRLGRVGGVQPIALAPRCRTKGVVVHEIGHAIGWTHEQARPDRDDFITVDFNKIPQNWRSQFAKEPAASIDDRDVTYDYESIMHYSGTVFGPRTIITRDPAFQNKLGQRIGLSFRDIKLANLMYRCAIRMSCPTTPPCPGEGFRLKNCKCVCPGPLGNPLVPCSDQPSVTTITPTATTTPAPTAITTGPPVPPGPDCMDLRENCQTLKNNGSCTRDPARMSIFCRKTCDLCNAETACMNYDDGCPFFANSGYCEREGVGQFFQEECPLSCGICSPVDACQAALDGSGSSRNEISLVITIIAMFMGIVCV